MKIIKTWNFDNPVTDANIAEIDDEIRKATESLKDIPSFTINGTPGYDIFWLDDHPEQRGIWKTIQLIIYTEAEIRNL